MQTLTSFEIAVLRGTRLFSQQQVAGLMKISSQRYSIMEKKNNLPAAAIERILKALGYTMKSAKKVIAAIPPYPPRKRRVKK